jgi:hypothetical protein
MSDANIEDLHTAYWHAIGFDLPLRMGRDRAWFDFEKAGFTKEDILLVIRWIRREIPKRTGYSINSLRFSTLLQLDYSEEKLLVARQQLGQPPRRAPVVQREQTVGDLRRLVEAPPVTAGEVGATQLRDWRLKFSGQLPTSDLAASETT